MLLILNCAPCLSIRPTNDYIQIADLSWHKRTRIIGYYDDDRLTPKGSGCKNVKSRYVLILDEGENETRLLHPSHLVNCNNCLFRGKFYENASK